MKKIIPKIIVNLITLTRLIGAILLPFIFLKYDFKIIFIITLIIYVTDLLDGFLARTFKCSCFFGAILDTISDKMLNMVVLVILGLKNRIMFIVLAMEVLIALVNLCKYKEGFNIRVNVFGKVKMLILGLTVLICYIAYTTTKFDMIFLSGLIYTLIGMQIITLFTYLIDPIKNPKFKVKIESKMKLKNKKEILNILFNTDFYLENREKPLKVLLYNNL